MLLKERLVELRTSLGLTKKEVAEKINIEQSTYGKYELGKRQPSLEILQRISEYFNVSTDYLLGGTDEAYQPNEAEAPKQTIITFGNNLGGQTYIVPEDKAERFRRLIEAAMPEILEKMERSDL